MQRTSGARAAIVPIPRSPAVRAHTTTLGGNSRPGAPGTLSSLARPGSYVGPPLAELALAIQAPTSASGFSFSISREKAGRVMRGSMWWKEGAAEARRRNAGALCAVGASTDECPSKAAVGGAPTRGSVRTSRRAREGAHFGLGRGAGAHGGGYEHEHEHEHEHELTSSDESSLAHSDETRAGCRHPRTAAAAAAAAAVIDLERSRASKPCERSRPAIRPQPRVPATWWHKVARARRAIIIIVVDAGGVWGPSQQDGASGRQTDRQTAAGSRRPWCEGGRRTEARGRNCKVGDCSALGAQRARGDRAAINRRAGLSGAALITPRRSLLTWAELTLSEDQARGRTYAAGPGAHTRCSQSGSRGPFGAARAELKGTRVGARGEARRGVPANLPPRAEAGDGSAGAVDKTRRAWVGASTATLTLASGARGGAEEGDRGVRCLRPVVHRAERADGEWRWPTTEDKRACLASTSTAQGHWKIDGHASRGSGRPQPKRQKRERTARRPPSTHLTYGAPASERRPPRAGPPAVGVAAWGERGGRRGAFEFEGRGARRRSCVETSKPAREREEGDAVRGPEGAAYSGGGAREGLLRRTRRALALGEGVRFRRRRATRARVVILLRAVAPSRTSLSCGLRGEPARSTGAWGAKVGWMQGEMGVEGGRALDPGLAKPVGLCSTSRLIGGRTSTARARQWGRAHAQAFFRTDGTSAWGARRERSRADIYIVRVEDPRRGRSTRSARGRRPVTRARRTSGVPSVVSSPSPARSVDELTRRDARIQAPGPANKSGCVEIGTRKRSRGRSEIGGDANRGRFYPAWRRRWAALCYVIGAEALTLQLALRLALPCSRSRKALTCANPLPVLAQRVAPHANKRLAVRKPPKRDSRPRGSRPWTSPRAFAFPPRGLLPGMASLALARPASHWLSFADQWTPARGSAARCATVGERAASRGHVADDGGASDSKPPPSKREGLGAGSATSRPLGRLPRPGTRLPEPVARVVLLASTRARLLLAIAAQRGSSAGSLLPPGVHCGVSPRHDAWTRVVLCTARWERPAVFPDSEAARRQIDCRGCGSGTVHHAMTPARPLRRARRGVSQHDLSTKYTSEPAPPSPTRWEDTPTSRVHMWFISAPDRRAGGPGEYERTFRTPTGTRSEVRSVGTEPPQADACRCSVASDGDHLVVSTQLRAPLNSSRTPLSRLEHRLVLARADERGAVTQSAIGGRAAHPPAAVDLSAAELETTDLAPPSSDSAPHHVQEAKTRWKEALRVARALHTNRTPRPLRDVMHALFLRINAPLQSLEDEAASEPPPAPSTRAAPPSPASEARHWSGETTSRQVDVGGSGGTHHFLQACFPPSEAEAVADVRCIAFQGRPSFSFPSDVRPSCVPPSTHVRQATSQTHLVRALRDRPGFHPARPSCVRGYVRLASAPPEFRGGREASVTAFGLGRRRQLNVTGSASSPSVRARRGSVAPGCPGVAGTPCCPSRLRGDARKERIQPAVAEPRSYVRVGVQRRSGEIVGSVWIGSVGWDGAAYGELSRGGCVSLGLLLAGRGGSASTPFRNTMWAKKAAAIQRRPSTVDPARGRRGGYNPKNGRRVRRRREREARTPPWTWASAPATGRWRERADRYSISATPATWLPREPLRRRQPPRFGRRRGRYPLAGGEREPGRNTQWGPTSVSAPILRFLAGTWDMIPWCLGSGASGWEREKDRLLVQGKPRNRLGASIALWRAHHALKMEQSVSEMNEYFSYSQERTRLVILSIQEAEKVEMSAVGVEKMMCGTDVTMATWRLHLRFKTRYKSGREALPPERQASTVTPLGVGPAIPAKRRHSQADVSSAPIPGTNARSGTRQTARGEGRRPRMRHRIAGASSGGLPGPRCVVTGLEGRGLASRAPGSRAGLAVVVRTPEERTEGVAVAEPATTSFEFHHKHALARARPIHALQACWMSSLFGCSLSSSPVLVPHPIIEITRRPLGDRVIAACVPSARCIPDGDGHPRRLVNRSPRPRGYRRPALVRATDLAYVAAWISLVSLLKLARCFKHKRGVSSRTTPGLVRDLYSSWPDFGVALSPSQQLIRRAPCDHALASQLPRRRTNTGSSVMTSFSSAIDCTSLRTRTRPSAISCAPTFRTIRQDSNWPNGDPRDCFPAVQTRRLSGDIESPHARALTPRRHPIELRPPHVCSAEASPSGEPNPKPSGSSRLRPRRPNAEPGPRRRTRGRTGSARSEGASAERAVESGNGEGVFGGVGRWAGGSHRARACRGRREGRADPSVWGWSAVGFQWKTREHAVYGRRESVRGCGRSRIAGVLGGVRRSLATRNVWPGRGVGIPALGGVPERPGCRAAAREHAYAFRLRSVLGLTTSTLPTISPSIAPLVMVPTPRTYAWKSLALFIYFTTWEGRRMDDKEWRDLVCTEWPLVNPRVPALWLSRRSL
ncbi:uncharacterized protein BXZ73DRAFT_78888 [Epithele typhae]|uniref:uncharacterized protein n=1 Tax=Epithele typhae TaxID=378194 RepID=UPI0020081588|nr:uncharacterized protein BXZ73DRAFT_78888 [Epithele typhae]KAH9925909.1 hypothetical protein BXZ73DRAFT_78888 [Epithele typhae]